VIVLSILTGVGVGGVLVPAATVAVMVTPDTSIATCVALSLAIRTVGGSIGYAIYYNVFINKLTTKLPTYIAQYAVQAGLPLESAEAFVGAYLSGQESLIAQVPGVSPAALAGAAMGSRWAYGDSLKWVWIATIPFGVCAIGLCCCESLYPIRKALTDQHGCSHAKHEEVHDQPRRSEIAPVGLFCPCILRIDRGLARACYSQDMNAKRIVAADSQ
jgi:hypothetical protein